jgi:hypothetical protein
MEEMSTSQLVVIYLGRFQETANLGASLVFGRQLVLGLLLLLHDVELGIISGEFLERDQKVTQTQSELIVLVVQREQALDEDVDLSTKRIVSIVPPDGLWACRLTVEGWGRRCATDFQRS